MQTLPNDDARFPIPRWRDPLHQYSIMESLSIYDNSADLSSINYRESINTLLTDWKTSQSVHVATDLVSAGIVWDKYDLVEDAADYIIANKGILSPQAISMAWQVKEQQESKNYLPFADGSPATLACREQIRRHRSLIRKYPYDSLRWIELSRLYTILGHLSQAKKSAEIALAMSRKDRLVLRNASRLFLHLSDPERSLHILRSSDNFRSDPWIMAAEIAIATANGSAPRSIKLARRMSDKSSINPFHTSELNAALASLEFVAGQYRGARRLYTRSLISPTENVVAQVAWAERNGLSIEYEGGQDSQVRVSHEAQSWEYFHNDSWHECYSSARKWLFDQPFSSRPAVFVSFLGTLLPEYREEAISLARIGLRANPDEFIICNNLSYMLAQSGQVAEAKVTLDRFKPNGPHQEITYLATMGFIAFQSGNVAEGDTLYIRAIDMARATGMKYHVTLATLFWAMNILSEDRSIRIPGIESHLDLGLHSDNPGLRLAALRCSGKDI